MAFGNKLTPIVGGKADGQLSPVRIVDFEADGDKYIRLEFKYEGVMRTIYMLDGMAPLTAIEAYKKKVADGTIQLR